MAQNMDPSHSPLASRKSASRPFYEGPEGRLTAAQIVAEAKLGLSQKKPVNTKRPETPRESTRQLFSGDSVRNSDNRPPSAISLNSRQFDSESRPPSGKRLLPLDTAVGKVELENALAAKVVKPPADPSRALRRQAPGPKGFKQSVSVDESVRNAQTDAMEASLPPLPVATSHRTEPRSNSAPKTRTEVVDKTQVPKSDSDDAIKRLNTTDTKNIINKKGAGDNGLVTYTSNGNSGKVLEDKTVRSNSGGQSRRTGSAGRSGSAGHRTSNADVRVGSGGRKESDETPEEAHFYNVHIAPIIDQMSPQTKGEKTADHLIVLADDLYTALEDAQLLGKACCRRSTILNTLFKLFNISSPRLWLKLARLILALKVSSANLLKCFKLVYQIAKDENNDTCFTEDNILDLMLDTMCGCDPVANSEALIYCSGSLKNLCNSTAVIKLLYKKKALDHIAKTVSAINKVNAEETKPPEHLGHTLVQLTSLLRSFAELSSARPDMINSPVIGDLFVLLRDHRHDRDIVFNTVRFFSKLTPHLDMCEAVCQQGSTAYKCFIGLLVRHKEEHISVIVRVCYILGNLTARLDEARVNLMDEPGALEIILDVLKFYLDIDLKAQAGSAEEKGVKDKAGDVLVKTVRLIANLSINPVVGPCFATSDACRHLLLQILDAKDLSDSEELVLNTLAAINNLSYYSIPASSIYCDPLPVAEALLKFVVQVNHREGLAEATRVLGNLTREKFVRDFIVSRHIDEAMVAMLSSSHREVVFTACGVLINLMRDPEKRELLKIQHGIPRLVEVLGDFGGSDWQLAGMVCQTLCNYSADITSTNDCFGEREATNLTLLLEKLLDEDQVTGQYSEDDEVEMKDYYTAIWSTDFCPVATQLLNRLERYQTDLEPL